MIFSSLDFLVFFIVYTLIWFLTPKKYKIATILIFSLFFYGYWNWNYILLPILLTLVAFIFTKIFQNNKSKTNLTISIILILLPLIYFKYFDFILNTKLIDMPIPLGISFITFTLISYVVDVYKNKSPYENSFSILLSYIMYFPQLIAGPILRPNELIPQLKEFIDVKMRLRFVAFVIFTIGLAKKTVFADQLAHYVDPIYLNPIEASFEEWLITFYAFPVQLYCDFSGYTDMAIGLALFFGVNLPLNFNKPYLVKTIPDFWRNWHISLSTWIRDYAYFPLGKILSNMYLRTLIVMTLVGLWHGASWTMVIFGFIHGILVAFSNFLRIKKIKNPLPVFMQIILTFHIFSATLILFRATDLDNALDMISVLINFESLNIQSFQYFLYPILLISIFFISHPFDNIEQIKGYANKYKNLYIGLFLVFLWILSISLSISNSGSDKFIYFDF